MIHITVLIGSWFYLSDKSFISIIFVSSTVVDSIEIVGREIAIETATVYFNSEFFSHLKNDLSHSLLQQYVRENLQMHSDNSRQYSEFGINGID